MILRVQMTPAAEASIAAQVNWFTADEERGGEALAEKWFNLLHAEIATLTGNPHLHAFAPENGKWQPKVAIRQMLFRPWKAKAGWRVLYTVDQRAKLVSVLQIRHEHRRWLHESKDEDA